MKNFLLFGAVTIFSFLICFTFLSNPGLSKSAAAVGFYAGQNQVSNLTSSVSYTSLLSASTVMPVNYAVSSGVTEINQLEEVPLSGFDAESKPEFESAGQEEKEKHRSVRSALLNAPIVDISGWQDEVDSSEVQAISSKTVSHSSPAMPVAVISRQKENGYEYTPHLVLEAYTKALAEFAKEHRYSEEIAFFVNLGMRSGKKRFYVVNLRDGSIITKGLVAHGQGKKQFTPDRQYSNKPGSKCSSLGIYRVGNSYVGGYGKSFRLTGLEKTNSNALERAIVLHAMNCIPDQEIEYPICQSEGCPSLSPGFLNEITPLIRSSKKPILLWVFDPTEDNRQ